MPPRPRAVGNRDLPPYLYRDAKGYYLVHPVTRQKARLGSDRELALTLHAEEAAHWRGEVAQHRAETLARRLRTAATPREQRTTLAAYCARWRAERLPGLVKRSGEPLGDKTRGDYDRMLRLQIETAEAAATPLANLGPLEVRTLLREWIDSPTFYNYLLAVVSRVLADAVDEGLLAVNPAREVRRRPTGKRKVTVSHEHYAAIMAHLADWQAAACDLIYLLGSRPGDALRLREDDFTEWEAPRDVRLEDGRVVRLYGVLRYRAAKTGALVEVEVNDALHGVLTGMRAWKRAQGLHGAVRHWIVHPADAHRRVRGRPVSVEALSRAFAAALEAAGIPKGTYTLRDLRPTGLTDDAIAGGDGAKGGHKTQAMRDHYRRVELPFRAVNTLATIRRKVG